MTAGISRWACWTVAGVTVNGAPVDNAGPFDARRQTLGPWPDAPPLSKIHPRARRPHPQAKALVQLASVVLGERRMEGLGLLVGSASGCAAPDREFQAELTAKGPGFGGPSLFVYTLPTAPLGEVAVAFGARGPLTAVSAGAASALTAIACAIDDVDAGRAPAVLCGGFEWGTAADHLALFLVEPDGPYRVTGSTGYGDAPDGARGTVLDVAAALTTGKAFAITAFDKLGYWAQLLSEGSAQ